jgi:hypothetical protein
MTRLVAVFCLAGGGRRCPRHPVSTSISLALAGTGMKQGDRVAQLVGWEYHGLPLGPQPGLVVLSQGPVYAASGQRTGTHATTLYATRGGALVFNAGSCWWNLVLASPPGFQNPPRMDFRRNDPRIQRMTKNILDRMIAIPSPK